METIYIHHHPVELYKILKFENLVGGGGEAKLVIASGYVMLNGEVETQKRKKINPGDIIEFNGEQFQIELCDEPPTENLNSQMKKAPDDTQVPTQNKAAIKPRRSAIKF